MPTTKMWLRFLLLFRLWPTISNQYRVKGFINNREEILIVINTTKVEMFEVDEGAITLEVRLYEYEDLDFYIIDAVDILVRLMEMTGKALQPREHDENLHHNPYL